MNILLLQRRDPISWRMTISEERGDELLIFVVWWRRSRRRRKWGKVFCGPIFDSGDIDLLKRNPNLIWKAIPPSLTKSQAMRPCSSAIALSREDSFFTFSSVSFSFSRFKQPWPPMPMPTLISTPGVSSAMLPPVLPPVFLLHSSIFFDLAVSFIFRGIGCLILFYLFIIYFCLIWLMQELLLLRLCVL